MLMNYAGLLLILFVKTIKGQGAPCLDASGRVQPGCLDGIKNSMFHPNYFWFGIDWDRYCTLDEAFTTVDCNNPDPFTKSLVERIFSPGTLDEATYMPDVFVNVTYESPPDKYVGCDHLSIHGTTEVFTLDPLSSDTYDPFDTRNGPTVSWDVQAGSQYTLLVIDGGFFFMHKAFINIPAEDLADGEEIRAYSGPRNYRAIANPYVFLLFRQNVTDMALDEKWEEALQFRMTRENMTDFMRENKLHGPIGVNWLKSWYDAQSVEGMRDMGIVENCASLAEEGLWRHPRPFIPPDATLSIFPSIRFISQPLSFQYCNNTYQYKTNILELDPIGDGVVKAAETRTDGTSRVVRMRPKGLFPDLDTSLQDSILTLLMVDPDVPIPWVGTNERPLVHWLVRNIRDGDITTGQTIHSYRGPRPPNQEPHTYYYLLYSQPDIQTYNGTNRWAGPCFDGNEGRCLFAVNQFVAENYLTLEGANWMIVQNDEYVNYTRIQEGGNEEDYCQWVRPCPLGPSENQLPAPPGHGSPLRLAVLHNNRHSRLHRRVRKTTRS